MKAIYIPGLFDPIDDLERLNLQLKECHKVVFKQKVNDNLPGGYYGTILIVDNYTRKDKLKKLKKISNEKGTTDNSI
jgi:hypothetical protein